MASQVVLKATATFPVQQSLDDVSALAGRDGKSASFQAILAAFIPTFITAVIYIIIFVQIRTKYSKIYTPRTYIGVVPEKHRTPLLPKGTRKWLNTFRQLNDKFVLRHQSLDGYLYLRFLRTIIFICFVGCCITWPILFPVNATGGGSASQLDRISFSNINGNLRLYAHAVVAWVFLGFVLVTVARERVFLSHLRQASLLAPSNAGRLSSRTVLFLRPPRVALDESKMNEVFGEDAVKQWTACRLSKLQSLVDERNTNASNLEVAEVKLIKNLNKRRLKSLHKTGSADGFDSSDLAADSKFRPTQRVPMLIGKKVDTINYSREMIAMRAEKIEKTRNSEYIKQTPIGSAVFVEFSNQAAAIRAYHQLNFGLPMKQLSPRYIGVLPKDIIWENVKKSPAARISEKFTANLFIVATIIFWTIPVSFIGTISNITYLADRVSWLHWIYDLPDPILGILTGLLPPLLLSNFVSYVPKFMRYIAKTFEPTTPAAEKQVQAWYFAFQVIQVFLITTVSSGAATIATKIAQNPGDVPALLARNLPKSSNFYLTYFILQGTSSAASNVLNYSDLLEYLGMGYLFDVTPRQKYQRYTQMKGISWGTVYPKFVNMAIIAIAYSCIAPLVLGFATLGLGFYYLSYRHNLLFVVQTKIDTRGEAYSRALQQLLTGVYLSELCLLGLFSIRKAPGPAALMGVLLVSTALYDIAINRFLRPLERFLPPRLRPEDEEAPLIDEGEAATDTNDDAGDSARSRIQHLGQAVNLPPFILNPLARFLEPAHFENRKELKKWFEHPDADDPPEYTDDELRTAYQDPLLTSKTPKVWLPRDDMGVSEKLKKENEEVDIATSDEGAWIDEKGSVAWEWENLERCSAWKKPVRY
ncbi:DUF221-domain-containing protein [Aulographum hederae CBS 113979]|uniref:DUF221-domain-containing protein n=1 Tax=Aulographum hederae CBS 113979 TaxID=1176131 RepID=A0A6G1GIA4_9PEZI|nr:DUF221-domain-containing protein [Aulographum hederae CBS 113979]